MELLIQNQTSQPKWNQYRKDFIRIQDRAVEVLQLNSNQTLSVIFVQDDEIQNINRTYRDKDQPTDVISFAMQDSEDIIDFNQLEEEIELGDIFINIDAVIRQSQEYKHTIRREVCFLFTHGLLHLLGYDHMNEDEEKAMFQLQDDILKDIAPKRYRRYE